MNAATLDGVKLITWKVDITWPVVPCTYQILPDGTCECVWCKQRCDAGAQTVHQGGQQTFSGTATVGIEVLDYTWTRPARMGNTRMPGAGLEELDFNVTSCESDTDDTATIHFWASRHDPRGHPG